MTSKTPPTAPVDFENDVASLSTENERRLRGAATRDGPHGVLFLLALPTITRTARGLLAITIADFARAAEISNETLADLETGARIPDARTVRAISRVLDDLGVVSRLRDGRVEVSIDLASADPEMVELLASEAVEELDLAMVAPSWK